MKTVESQMTVRKTRIARSGAHMQYRSRHRPCHPTSLDVPPRRWAFGEEFTRRYTASIRR